MGIISRSALSILLLLIGQWASGQGWEAALSGGYRQENLHWSIAGNSAGQAPNIYSELKWRHVGGFAVDGALRYGFGRRWVFFAEGSRMFTSTGRVSDKDYAGDNRTNNIYEEDFAGSNGYSMTIGAGAGYRLWPGGRFELTPSLGYGVSGQHLTITDPGGFYTFLNSSYQTSWFGPFVRGAGRWRPGGRWVIDGIVTYHQVTYRANADWNLISDFSHPVSFRHRADGFGIEGELGVRYSVCRRVEVLAAMNGFAWETGTGIDELYHPGSPSQQTQLNEVVMDGLGFRLGMRWKW
ncbi:MAG TPA: hypothetical protein VNW04_09925 [Puia sp.]|nr:hypothetical protein [Puia sp.]